MAINPSRRRASRRRSRFSVAGLLPFLLLALATVVLISLVWFANTDNMQGTRLGASGSDLPAQSAPQVTLPPAEPLPVVRQET